MVDVARKTRCSNLGMGCLEERKERYTNVVGYWKEMWRTDKAANVAHGETDVWCMRYSYDVVSDLMWETGCNCPGRCPHLVTLLHLYSILSAVTSSSTVLLQHLCFGLASSTLVIYSSCVSFRVFGSFVFCLLYTSPSPRDLSTSRMPSSA